MFSDAANQRGPPLVQTLGNELIAVGVDESALTLGAPVGEARRPHLSLAETQALIESPLRRLAARHGLSAEEAAHAYALAAARLVKMCAEALDAKIGFALAAQGFVERSKTMPTPPAGDARSPRH